MAGTYTKLYYHIVFSTKNRESFIAPRIEPELHPYMAKIFRALKSPSLAIDGTTDHIHILFLRDANDFAGRVSVPCDSAYVCTRRRYLSN